MNKIFLFFDLSSNHVKSQLKVLLNCLGFLLCCGLGVGCESSPDSLEKMNPVEKVTSPSKKDIKKTTSSVPTVSIPPSSPVKNHSKDKTPSSLSSKSPLSNIKSSSNKANPSSSSPSTPIKAKAPPAFPLVGLLPHSPEHGDRRQGSSGAFAAAGLGFDYDDFSVRVAENALRSLTATLKAIPKARVVEMRRKVLLIRDYFVYKDMYAPDAAERRALLAAGRQNQDAFLLLAMALEARARDLGRLPKAVEAWRPRNRKLLGVGKA